MKLLLRSIRPGAGTTERVVIERSPFVLGRGEHSDVPIPHPEISGAHAAFHLVDGEWVVEDLGSTNGTFLNGIRLTAPTPLSTGNLLHFGTVGYKIVSALEGGTDGPTTAIAPDVAGLIQSLAELHRVMDEDRLYPAFQPIVRLTDGRAIGWETLGRAFTRTNLDTGVLFELATLEARAGDLSRAFFESARKCVTCHQCWPDAGRPHLFVNLHPDEILTPHFPAHLDRLKGSGLDRHFQVVLEFPESLAGNRREMKEWIGQSRTREMLVAYDDFGKGQSRITDLTEVPPDFLKLDRDLVRGLDTGRPREKLLRAVVESCGELGAEIIAEGVETPQEAQACRELGIRLAQGYHFARPAPAWELFEADTDHLPAACAFHRTALASA